MPLWISGDTPLVAFQSNDFVGGHQCLRRAMRWRSARCRAEPRPEGGERGSPLAMLSSEDPCWPFPGLFRRDGKSANPIPRIGLSKAGAVAPHARVADFVIELALTKNDRVDAPHRPLMCQNSDVGESDWEGVRNRSEYWFRFSKPRVQAHGAASDGTVMFRKTLSRNHVLTILSSHALRISID
jgi:hypothetical protein